MKKWNIHAAVGGSKFLGTVEAETQEEALEKADEEFLNLMDISLCWQCSEEIEDPQITEIIAEGQDD